MDLGFFKRSRRRFAAWILFPILVLVSVCSFWWLSSRSTHEALNRRSAYLEVLPEMDRKLDLALCLLHTLAIETEDGAGAVDALTSEIQEAAREQSFTINSLAFKEVDAKEGEDLVAAWIAVVKGEGSLTSVVRFLGEIYTEHRLMVVESSNLRTVGAPAEQNYMGEFRLRFLDVSIPDEVELVHHMGRNHE